jgi:hypothetical protein
LRQQVSSLCRLEPEAEWSKSIEANAPRVDTALTQRNLPGVRLAFQRYRADTLKRFFVVDKLLRADCDAAITIGAPLRNLLAEANRV